jgi:hypothetical protein
MYTWTFDAACYRLLIIVLPKIRPKFICFASLLNVRTQTRSNPKNYDQGRVFAILTSQPSSGSFPWIHSSPSDHLPSRVHTITSIVRHLTRTQSTSLHWRRRRRLLRPRRRRRWWRLLPRRPVAIRTLRPARRSTVTTVTIAVACIADFAVGVFEHIGAVAAVFRLRGAQVETHVGDLRRVCGHTTQRAHAVVGWRAGAVAERGWAFEAGL